MHALTRVSILTVQLSGRRPADRAAFLDAGDAAIYAQPGRTAASMTLKVRPKQSVFQETDFCYNGIFVT